MIGRLRRLRSQSRDERTGQVILAALAEVGPLGMTPNALEVSTEVPESRLRAVVARLIDAGLVCRRRRVDAERVGYRQGELLLLTEYTKPHR
jgi:DNA-binding MarR family transcriptional regulator